KKKGEDDFLPKSNCNFFPNFFFFFFLVCNFDSSTMAASDVVWKNETLCITDPTKVALEGFPFDNTNIVVDLFSATLPLLNIQILFILAISNSLNCILKRFRIPPFISQALTGVILGPTLLGSTTLFKYKLFPQSSQYPLEAIALIGFATTMFLLGVKMDVVTVLNSDKRALLIGLTSLILPLVVGMAAQSPKIRNTDNKFIAAQMFAITGTASATTIATVSELLDELSLTNSETGRLALSSALVSGKLSTASLYSKFGILRKTFNALGTLFAILAAIFVLRPTVFKLVINKTPSGERVNPSCIFAIMATAIAYEVFFDGMRQSFILGPFIFGLLVIPPGPPLGSSLVETLEPLSEAVFLPVYIAMTVMKADLNTVFSNFDGKEQFTTLICWTAILKFSACFLLALRWVPVLDSIVLALIMSSKGVVDISMHAFLRDNQKVLPQVYSLFIFAIMITATVVPILVRFLYQPSRRYASSHSRNIYALKPFSELRILACIHKPHHVVSVTKLLDTLCRTEGSVVALCVIHLLEQVGHAGSMFICHQKQRKWALFLNSSSPSIDIVFTFTQYETNNIGLTSLQSFTSISQFKFMQEDIFTLALDKVVSLILIPFHRKWSFDGTVESEDNALRALNARILNKAPCSVGILYDRRRSKSHEILAEEYKGSFSSCSVCMIYLGGRDDQEALSLSKRMANDPLVHLTIMNMVADEEAHGVDIEGNLVLRKVLQETANYVNVQYLEKAVNDGAETTKCVSSIASQYDLFIVGRRSDIDMDSPQTEGLTNWSEFPELGVLGDLLASNEVHTRGSVLVVQQQKKL
ncbi:Cation/H(+) antiporter 4, partial [Linum perenne]